MVAEEKNTRFERRMKLAYIDEMRRGEAPPAAGAGGGARGGTIWGY